MMIYMPSYFSRRIYIPYNDGEICEKGFDMLYDIINGLAEWVAPRALELVAVFSFIAGMIMTLGVTQVNRERREEYYQKRIKNYNQMLHEANSR